MTLTKIKSDGIQDNSVTTAKIATDAVTTGKIANDAINAAKIASGAVGSTELGAGVVDTIHIADGNITTAKIADDSITTAKIANGEINSAKMGTDSVATSAIQDQAVTLAKLEHGTSSNNGKFLRANNGADPTFETVNTDLVSDTSPQLGGNLASNGNDILMADNDKIKIGTGEDLDIYHSGVHSYIDNEGIGDLFIRSTQTNGDVNIRVSNGNGGFTVKSTTDEDMINAVANGAVELYNDNLKQVETFHASSVGHSPSGGSDITGGGLKTTRTGSHNSNIGYYCYKDSNLVARLTNHGSGPEGLLQLYNQGVPKLSMNGTNGTIILNGTAGYIQFGDTNSTEHQLNDYEEGTWTPTQPTVGMFSDDSLSGHFQKIGNFVHFQLQCRFNTNGSSVHAVIDSFPFTSAESGNNYDYGASVIYATRSIGGALIANGGSRIYLYDTSGNNLNCADMSGKFVRLNGFVEVT